MSDKLSEQAVKRHLSIHLQLPDRCPVCGGVDGSAVVLAGDAFNTQFDDVQVHLTQTVSCSCGASWTDFYRLVGLNIEDYGSRADALEDPDKPVRGFLKRVANLTKDGEIEVHDGQDVKYKQKPNDAVQTLQGLIEQARAIAKAADIDTDTYDAEVHIDA